MLITAAVISGVMFLALTFHRPGRKSALTTTQATLLINREDAIVIDVRQPDEYISGHLPESRNIPLKNIDDHVAELDKLKNTPLIMVCQTGSRSESACKKLDKLGFTQLNNLAGGINAWKDAGLPLKKGNKK